MTNYVLQGLIKKRAEISGALANMHETVGKMVRDLEHIDATIKLIDPDYQPEGISPKMFRPPEDWSKRGQMSRMILSILRTAKEPMTSREIAAKMIFERGLATDMKMLKLMSRRVGSSLRDMRDKGRADHDGAGGMYQLWHLVRE
jgi:hypothetical protein